MKRARDERCKHGRLAPRCEACRADEIRAMTERVLSLTDEERAERAATYHSIFGEE